MAVTKEEIAEIKSRVSILDVVGQVVQLKKQGRNYLGLCPFHGEKTPSFSVNAEKGFYHCFGCGKSGDVFQFIQDSQTVDFQAALAQVAEMAGISVSFDKMGETQEDDPNRALFDINNQAARMYHMILTSTQAGVAAHAYLSARGIDEDTIKRYEIGLAPDNDDFLYQNLSVTFDESVLADSGLFNFSRSKVFDTFQNRLMFPIRNQYGQTVGFSGRIWQEGDTRQGKYVNTSATKIFDKSFELWNFDKARASIAKMHEVVLMEGFMDVIAAHRAGVDNAVASMGTALTEKHVKRLSRLAQKFVLVYDGDAAGQAAIYKALALLENREVAIVKIPDGKDPDDYQRTQGIDALRALLGTTRISRSEFLMAYLRPENLSTVDTQVDFLGQLAPIIAHEMSLAAQDVYVKRLTELLPDFEYDQVEKAVNQYRNSGSVSADRTDRAADRYYDTFSELDAPQAWPQEQPEAQEAFIAPLAGGERLEQQLLSRLTKKPELIDMLEKNGAPSFIHTDYQHLFGKIINAQLSHVTDWTEFALTLPEPLRGKMLVILALDLPEIVTDREILELTESLAKAAIQQKIEAAGRELTAAQQLSDSEKVLRLTIDIVALKKQLQGETSK
ncbi:MAG: DNA primase [Streptococcaceae bacterium]|jgi:DNA primase|nr:DNA primase [Streptococcaceae bacterium]